MDGASFLTADRKQATTTPLVTGYAHDAGATNPHDAFCDIRRRPTGFIDYDFYREAAMRERDRASQTLVMKLRGMFAGLFRLREADPGFAGIVNTQQACV